MDLKHLKRLFAVIYDHRGNSERRDHLLLENHAQEWLVCCWRMEGCQVLHGWLPCRKEGLRGWEGIGREFTVNETGYPQEIEGSIRRMSLTKLECVLGASLYHDRHLHTIQNSSVRGHCSLWPLKKKSGEDTWTVLLTHKVSGPQVKL